MAEVCEQLSCFYEQLESTGKQRYKSKLDMLGINEDPYSWSIGDWTTDRRLWPAVDFPDICVYLINSPSPITREALKAYKSSEAWAFFTAGFVDDIRSRKVQYDIVVMIAKVYVTIKYLI